jgi:hypothetical protein
MRIFLAIAVWLSAGPVFAEIIQQANHGFGGISAWASKSKFGQSFTATPNEPQADTVSLLWGGSSGFEQYPAPTIATQLRSGSGLDGDILGTSSAVGPIPYDLPSSIWIDFKFSKPIALVTGEVYTLRFDVLPQGSVAGSIGMSFLNPYPGGQYFGFGFTGFPTGPDGDLDFRVLSSPEPSTLLLLAIGAISLVGRRNVRGTEAIW